MIAKFPGHCYRCDRPFPTGATIARDARGQAQGAGARWAHQDCIGQGAVRPAGWVVRWVGNGRELSKRYTLETYARGYAASLQAERDYQIAHGEQPADSDIRVDPL